MKEEKIYAVPVPAEKGAQIQIPRDFFSFFENGANSIATGIFLGLTVMGIILATGLVLAAWILK